MLLDVSNTIVVLAKRALWDYEKNHKNHITGYHTS